MLVLDRKIGQTIVFTINGVESTLTVRDIKSKRATITIDAPDAVHIRRGELEPYERKVKE